MQFFVLYSKLFPQRFGELDRKLIDVEQKISGLENNISDNVITRLNNFASSISALENKLDSINVSNTNNDNSVSKEEFNKIMGNVGNDVGVLTDQVGDLKDLVLNIQNSTILLDKTIIEILENYEKILEIILPTLRKERKSTYSPFLPISKKTGNVLQIQIDEYRPKNNSIIYKETICTKSKLANGQP